MFFETVSLPFILTSDGR